MTPSALLGGASTGASTSTSSNSSTGNRGSSAANDGGFASMLERPSTRDTGKAKVSTRQDDAPRGTNGSSAQAQAKTSTQGKPAGHAKDSAAAKDASSTPSDKIDDAAPGKQVADADAAQAAPTAQADPATQEAVTAAAPTDAPWPPPGLAGLALSLPAIATDADAALPSTTLPGIAGSALAPQTIALQNTTAPTAGGIMPATPGAPGAIALPTQMQAQASDDAGALQVSQLFEQAMADAGAGADVDAPTTAPTLLHALGAAPELRGTAQAASIFSGDPTPVPDLQAEGFDEAISTRVGWLADQKIGHAHIRISPDDLGQIDVRLQMDGDRIHATFQSNHADVRQALEQSLPRLREMLGEQGFQLGNADVGHQQQGQPGADGNAGGHGGTGGELAGGTSGEISIPAPLARLNRLLDAYA